MLWALLLAVSESINWTYVLVGLFAAGGAGGLMHSIHVAANKKEEEPKKRRDVVDEFNKSYERLVTELPTSNTEELYGDSEKWIDAHEFKGAKYQFLKEGKTRQVHVNPHAIRSNVLHKENYPTIIVVEDGVESQYHGIVFHGRTRMMFNADPTVNANVYAETSSPLSVYLIPDAPLEHPRRPLAIDRPDPLKSFFEVVFKRPVVGVLSGLGFVAKRTPVLSCLLFDPNEEGKES